MKKVMTKIITRNLNNTWPDYYEIDITAGHVIKKISDQFIMVHYDIFLVSVSSSSCILTWHNVNDILPFLKNFYGGLLDWLKLQIIFTKYDVHFKDFLKWKITRRTLKRLNHIYLHSSTVLYFEHPTTNFSSIRMLKLKTQQYTPFAFYGFISIIFKKVSLRQEFTIGK